jgi:hypothetical protein
MKGLLSTVVGIAALSVSRVMGVETTEGVITFGGIFSEFDNGVKMTLEGSSCSMQYDWEPYHVKCDLVINAIDKFGKTEFISKSVVGGSFTTAQDGTITSTTIEYK